MKTKQIIISAGLAFLFNVISAGAEEAGYDSSFKSQLVDIAHKISRHADHAEAELDNMLKESEDLLPQEANVSNTDTVAGDCDPNQPGYALCRYQAAQNVMAEIQDSIQTTHTVQVCRKGEKHIKFISLYQYEYDEEIKKPSSALECAVVVNGRPVSLAFHTKPFCRNNTTRKLDSFDETIAVYKQAGYDCRLFFVPGPYPSLTIVPTAEPPPAESALKEHALKEPHLTKKRALKH